jgi:hypothetical protein
MQKLHKALASAAATLPAAIPDALIVTGTGVLSYGAWLVYPAAGYLTGGGLMLVFGVLGAIKGGK